MPNTPQYTFYVKEGALFYEDQEGVIYTGKLNTRFKPVENENNDPLAGTTKILHASQNKFKIEKAEIGFLPAGFRFDVQEGRKVCLLDHDKKPQAQLPELLNPNDSFEETKRLAESKADYLVTVFRESENPVFIKEVLMPILKPLVLGIIIATPVIALGVAAWPYVSMWIATAVWPVMLVALPYVGIVLAGVVGVTLLTMALKNMPWKGMLDTLKQAGYLFKLAIHKVRAKSPMNKQQYGFKLVEEGGKLKLDEPETSAEENETNKSKTGVRFTDELKIRANYAVTQCKLDHIQERIKAVEDEIKHLANKLEQLDNRAKLAATQGKEHSLIDSAKRQIRADEKKLSTKKEELKTQQAKYQRVLDEIKDNIDKLKETLLNKASDLGAKGGAVLRIRATNSNIGPTVDLVQSGGEIHRLGHINAADLSFVPAQDNNNEPVNRNQSDSLLNELSSSSAVAGESTGENQGQKNDDRANGHQSKHGNSTFFPSNVDTNPDMAQVTGRKNSVS